MSRFSGLRLVPALLAVLLTAGLASPAQAGPRSPDPELAQPHESAVPPASGANRAAPASIDSDVYAYALSPTVRVYFVVTGHLQLQQKSGSTTQYKGSFVDYVGNKSYKASADASDPNAPTITLKTKNGTFEFVSTSSFGGSSYSGTGTKVPSKLKVAASTVQLGAAAHSASTRSYAITLTERSGVISTPFEYVGNLTLVYDANGRISGGSVTVTNSKGKNVTNAVTNTGYSSGGYFYTVVKVDKTYFGITATITGNSVSGYAFGGSGAKTTQWLLSGTA